MVCLSLGGLQIETASIDGTRCESEANPMLPVAVHIAICFTSDECSIIEGDEMPKLVPANLICNEREK